MVSTRHCANAFLVAVLLFSLASPTQAIGKREFFERLQEAWDQIHTFQADVIQESRYPDGVVQRYQGKLALAEDGRIAYDYDLVGEWNDPSLIASKGKKDRSTEPPPNPPEQVQPGKSTHAKGSYRAQGDLVDHYVPDENLLLEGPENETLLIQVFRSMLGSGEFDVEKFNDENKITSIEETVMEDGTPVYKLVATPRKGTDMYNWAKKMGNQALRLEQELWVETATMRPIKAVLLSDEESTSVQLKNSRYNAPVDPNSFMLPIARGKLPTKVQKGSMPPSAREIQSRPLDEIPVEEDRN
jgi:outer membrane lipoprotein-sorting protein